MKKKIGTLSKAVNKASIKKRIQKKEPKKQEVDPNMMEEIDSDFLSESKSLEQKPYKPRIFDLDESDENEKTEETADHQRIKLAKQLLSDTYQQVQKDDFFLDGVQLMDEEKKINQALQNQILGKKNLIFTETARLVDKEKISQEYYKGHTRCITGVQFDPLGKHLYTVSKDCSIIKWDMETKKKQFISLGKDEQSHKHDILSASLNYDGKILATSGTDTTVKLWDTLSNTLITTLKSHRSPVYAVKFGLNSNNLCSVSNDRTLKLWDAGERAYIDTFFGHRSDIVDLDAVNQDTFLSCGFDKQAILWKTKHGSQLIFNGHDYSIDCIRSLTPDFFITGSQDTSISLWSLSKKRPIWTKNNAHGANKWITALGAIHNCDLVASGSYNNQVNLYRYDPKQRKLEDLLTLPSNGIVNNLVFTNNQQYLASVQSDEHRLGRWITQKAKNQVIVYKLW